MDWANFVKFCITYSIIFCIIFLLFRWLSAVPNIYTHSQNWTRSCAGLKNVDCGAWQVGFSIHMDCTIVGIFDHTIAGRSHFRNLCFDLNKYWTRIVLVLGAGHGNLYGQNGIVSQSEEAVVKSFSRWGRDPDDVADWMIFTKSDKLPLNWFSDLPVPNKYIGVDFDKVCGLCREYSAIILWALDGHLYAALPNTTEEQIRTKLMPFAKELGLDIAKHQQLVLDA